MTRSPGEKVNALDILSKDRESGCAPNWQYGKYTDPKNNGYNVWMDFEKLFVPR